MEDENESIEYIENRYLYSWGFGKYGQIGLKFVNYSITPIKQNIEDNEEIFLIAAGECHSALLTLTPKLFVYGKNYFGQLGIGNNYYVFNPMKLDFSEKIKISKVVCGGDHTIALSEDNCVYTWGLNAFGQLGHGDFLQRKNPTKVELHSHVAESSILQKNELVVDIAAGAQHSMIVTSKNKLYTCGFAKFKSLGYDAEDDVNQFKMIESIVCKNSINKISCGVYHSGCIIDNEIIYIWGTGEVLKFDSPTVFSLGVTNNQNQNSSPNKKPNPSNFVREIKIGEDIVFILSKNDEIFGMGQNNSGQLGNKMITPRNFLEKIETPKVKQLEVGYNFVIIISFDNKIYGWGNNEYGQLGITKSITLLEPTYLEELTKMEVFKLACGGYHCLGLFNKNMEENSQGEANKLMEELKKNLKISNLNSTIRRDYMTATERNKLVATIEKKISELENSINEKNNTIKELKLKDEELNKKIEEGGKDTKKPTKFSVMNPRGFDNTFEISIKEIEMSNEDTDIGRGTFGDVRRGIWRKENVAVKFLKTEMTSSEENINAFIEECNMLKNLRHPNILLFMGASSTPPYYFVVTEFCENGNLFELLHQHQNIVLNWEEKRRIALEIALGMNYLHSFEPPILHRDLKSMNVLLDKNFQVKIADFGSTKFLEVQMTKQKGTFQWMAPEVIKGSSYTEKADVFSFGIIMNELASRKPPYYGIDKKEVARNVATNPSYRPGIDKKYPKEWVELMVKCWEHSPNKRPNFSDIIDSLMKMKLR